MFNKERGDMVVTLQHKTVRSESKTILIHRAKLFKPHDYKADLSRIVSECSVILAVMSCRQLNGFLQYQIKLILLVILVTGRQLHVQRYARVKEAFNRK